MTTEQLEKVVSSLSHIERLIKNIKNDLSTHIYNSEDGQIEDESSIEYYMKNLFTCIDLFRSSFLSDMYKYTDYIEEEVEREVIEDNKVGN